MQMVMLTKSIQEFSQINVNNHGRRRTVDATNPGVVEGNDERRSSSSPSSEESGLVPWDQKTDDSERSDVDDAL